MRELIAEALIEKQEKLKMTKTVIQFDSLDQVIPKNIKERRQVERYYGRMHYQNKKPKVLS